MDNKDTEKQYSDDEKNVVIARLEAMPPNISISIGGGDGYSGYSVKDLVEKIRKNDEIGKKIIEMQLSYIRSLKNLQLEVK